MIASLNNMGDYEHFLRVIVNDGVSMIKKKKSYSDVLKTGTPTKLKNPPYQRDSITGCVTLD